MVMWWVRQVLSWGKEQCAPCIQPQVLSLCTSPALPNICKLCVMSGQACQEQNKSPSFMLALAAGKSGSALLHPRPGRATARATEAGLKRVPGSRPAGNTATIEGCSLMAPAQRRVLSEQRCRRIAGAAIGCVQVYPGA